MTRNALVGDHDESITAHRAIALALDAASAELGIDASWQWIHTADPDADRVTALFQPERAALAGRMPALVRALLAAAARND